MSHLPPPAHVAVERIPARAAPDVSEFTPVAVLACSSRTPAFGQVFAALRQFRDTPVGRGPVRISWTVPLDWADESPTEVLQVVPLLDAGGRIVG